MAEWSELKAEFEALRDAMRFYRLDYQWGSAGIYYRLAGGGSSHATRRFEVLADIAGQKLLELPEGTLQQAVLQAPDASSRWHEALRYHSGAFEFGFMGKQTDEAGADLGNIYTGTLNLPAESSALLCLQFSSLPVVTPVTPGKAGALARVNKFLHREAEQRGYLWLFVGFVVSVVLAVLAL